MVAESDDVCSPMLRAVTRRVLEWAWEHQCRWEAYSCAAASQGGRPEVLKWLREYHCPFGTRVGRVRAPLRAITWLC